jgi:hypothetical protein
MSDLQPLFADWHHRVSKYAAIGAPIRSLICYVYILMQAYAK